MGGEDQWNDFLCHCIWPAHSSSDLEDLEEVGAVNEKDQSFSSINQGLEGIQWIKTATVY